jgi:predicted ATPase
MATDFQGDGGYLMAKTIDIKNFRAFSNVTLPDCRRVNIVVGENGSGKTALLEALFLTVGGNPEVALRAGIIYVTKNAEPVNFAPATVAATRYRGLALPKGMTPACLDEMARLINRHGHDLDEWSDAELAVRLYRVALEPR